MQSIKQKSTLINQNRAQQPSQQVQQVDFKHNFLALKKNISDKKN